MSQWPWSLHEVPALPAPALPEGTDVGPEAVLPAHVERSRKVVHLVAHKSSIIGYLDESWNLLVGQDGVKIGRLKVLAPVADPGKALWSRKRPSLNPDLLRSKKGPTVNNLKVAVEEAAADNLEIGLRFGSR